MNKQESTHTAWTLVFVTEPLSTRRGKERKWVLLAGVAARARQVGVESNDNYIAGVHEETKVTRKMYIGNE